MNNAGKIIVSILQYIVNLPARYQYQYGLLMCILICNSYSTAVWDLWQ